MFDWDDGIFPSRRDRERKRPRGKNDWIGLVIVFATILSIYVYHI